MGSEGLSQSSLLYRLTDRLPVRATFLVAIQHVLAKRRGGKRIERDDGRVGSCSAIQGIARQFRGLGTQSIAALALRREAIQRRNPDWGWRVGSGPMIYRKGELALFVGHFKFDRKNRSFTAG